MLGRLRDEGGATAVLVAILLLVLFGAAAVAVDLGASWDTRRDLVADTDAAALAAGRTAAESGCGDAQITAAEYLSANLRSTVDPLDLNAPGNVFNCGNGRVEVGYTVQSDNVFAPAVGASDRTAVSSISIASYSAGGGGLRPIAACMFDSAIQGWLAGGAGTTYDFSLGGGATNCGSAPGNWGWTCFDRSHGPYEAGRPTGCDGNNGQPRIDTMLEHGYSGIVDLGEPPSEPDDNDCDPDTPALDRCDQKPGSLGNSVNGALTYLRDSGLEFPILGIEDWQASGSNGTTSPVAFIGVRVIDFQLTGPMGNRFIRFELVNLFQEGTSAVQLGGSSGTIDVALCGVDDLDLCPTP